MTALSTYGLSPDHRRLDNLARTLSHERFAPRAAQYDQTATLPADNLQDLREAGLLGLVIGKDLGGLGSGIGGEDPLAYLLVLERLAEKDLSTSHCLQVHCHAAHFIDRLGTASQRHTILGDVIENGALTTTLSSEPGRTARGTRNASRAELLDDGWRINGLKNYSTLASASTWLLTLVDAHIAPHPAVAEGDRVAFAIRRDAVGVSFDSAPWDPFGMRGALSPTVRFDDTRVSWERLIGQPNAHLSGGWSVRADLGFAAQYVGASQGLFDEVVAAVNRRSTHSNPHAQSHVGALHIAIAGARALYRNAASLWTHDPEAAALASVGAKYQSIATANLILDLAAKIVGPTAFSRGGALERQYRDLRYLTMREHPDAALVTMGQTLLTNARSQKEKAEADAQHDAEEKLQEAAHHA